MKKLIPTIILCFLFGFIKAQKDYFKIELKPTQKNFPLLKTDTANTLNKKELQKLLMSDSLLSNKRSFKYFVKNKNISNMPILNIEGNTSKMPIAKPSSKETYSMLIFNSDSSAVVKAK